MTQLEELEQAVKDRRQPVCVACGRPLDIVCQDRPSYVYWVWDASLGCYVRGDDEGGCDKPFHEACGYGDWDLIEAGSPNLRLGLTY